MNSFDMDITISTLQWDEAAMSRQSIAAALREAAAEIEDGVMIGSIFASDLRVGHFSFNNAGKGVS